MPPRNLTFGSVAERYERYRPGYPDELFDLVVGDVPVSTAIEIGAGTGKATRVVASRGIIVTAVEPDPQMGAVLSRKTSGLPVTVVSTTLEELPVQPAADLLYAAAAWHWTDPATRWERAAALVRPGGVFASLGGPINIADEALADEVERLRDEVIGTEDIAGTEGEPDGMAWPGNELLASPYFTDVQQHDLPATVPMAADDLVGLMSTVSAYLLLSEQTRTDLLDRIRALLPDTLDVRRDLTLHRARRTDVGQTGTSSTAPTA
jgi:SAM-dependent methyltransferase